MKSIIVSTYDDPKNPFYAGGGAISVHQIFKRLTDHYRITIVTGMFPGSSQTEIIDGLKYVRIGLRINQPQLSLVAYQIILPFMVLSQKYDLWIESFTSPFSTNFLQLFTSKPVVGLVHMLSGSDMYRKYKLPIFTPVENLGLKTYKYFISTTDWVKHLILNSNRTAEVKVIPNGMDLPEKPKITGFAPSILFVGRLEINQKGLDTLVQAFSRVTDFPDLKLVIAGSGSRAQIASLRRLVRQTGQDAKIQIVGRLTGEALDRAYFRSGLVVIPSRFETFSMVALEAMAHGKPLVYSDISGLSWIPEGAGIKLKNLNSLSLAEAIIKLLRSPSAMRRMGKVGYKFASIYTWDNQSAQYRNFIDEILKKS
jgi:phosphatidyl-myo-inositol alpha-mannosyltransferase